MENIAARIEAEVRALDGVTVHPHRFGGLEFRLGRRELGHLHGERWADIRFRKTVRDMLVETERAEPHHVLPQTGWVSKRIRDEEDVRAVVELFRLSWERAQIDANVRSSRSTE